MQCTRKLLEQLLFGLDVPNTGHVTVLDMMYNFHSFNEVGKAAWDLQKQALEHPNTQNVTWMYWGMSCEDDVPESDIESRKKALAALIRAATWPAWIDCSCNFVDGRIQKQLASKISGMVGQLGYGGPKAEACFRFGGCLPEARGAASGSGQDCVACKEFSGEPGIQSSS